MMAFSLRPAASLLSIVAIVVSVGAFAPPTRVSPSPARSAAAASSLLLRSSTDEDVHVAMTSSSPPSPSVSRRSAMSGLAAAVAGTTISVSPFVLAPPPALARLEGVNKPELLPSEPGLNVIQVEKFLTKGQEKRMDDLLAKLEKDTGYRVRVLCQAYPRTPG